MVKLNDILYVDMVKWFVNQSERYEASKGSFKDELENLLEPLSTRHGVYFQVIETT